ncbi:MAG: HAD hydrolase-like protein, partial [Gemmatimonadota bacterium]
MNEQGSGPAKVAVIWDFDGTLVNSHPRNLSVNRAIVEEVTDRSHECFPALVSIAAYEAAVARASDWREFYASKFGLGEDEIERASALWSRLQLSDATPQSPFEGIGEALAALQDLPLGILSQNDSVVIRRALEHAGLLWRFDTVLGYG